MAKTWLITGASRGLGFELAVAALEAGENVVATARRPEQLRTLVERYGDRVRTTALDVTDEEAARAAVALAVRELGRLDVVANNAGYANSAPIELTSDADFRGQFEANFFGLVNVTRAALPLFREQRSGHYVQYSSVGGRVGGSSGLAAYQSAKFAVEGFSEVLANELRPFGVKVTIVEPGAFRTEWQGSSMTMDDGGPDYAESVGAMHRFRRETQGRQPGDPARAGKAVVQAVALEAPPRRLVLGASAVDYVRRSEEARLAELERFAPLSRSADFPEGE
ncbi:MAG TPA: oxidoreductase [Conexibacter sp.]|jgi:NAD(P)-dependent dehydrogenase (short-subunit alcohol dehydrogenase family)